MYSLGLGGTISSTATRVDKFNAYWSVAKLKEPKKKGPSALCDGAPNIFVENSTPSSSSLLIQSDLGLKDWLVGALKTEGSIYSDQMPSSGTSGATNNGGSGSKTAFEPSELSIEIKFIVVSTGNVTPTWKLVRVSANTGNSPLFSSGRTRTHDLLITFGPQKNTSLHTAGQIGQAFSSALTSASQQ